MLRPRITPCLLVHDKGLVKTVRFGDPKYVGDPINAVRIFNEKQADELIVLDIDATVRRSEPDLQRVEHLAVECRMPLCYGGGVKTAAQAKRIVSLGVEKVAVSSAALEDPAVVRQMADEVGSQSVVVVLDVRLRAGEYEVWTHNGSRPTGRALAQAIGDVEASGAGEVLVNSIDNDGVMKGYDLALATLVREATSLPITLLGGAGSLEDMRRLIETCGVLGVAAGSLFVFKGVHRAVLINYPNEDRKDELIRGALAARR